MKKNNEVEIVNLDSEGNVINEAFPVSERAKKDQSKTSVIYTLLAFILHVLAFVPILAVSVVLAVKCYELTPYYSFWPFLGLIIVGVFGIIYLVVALIVTRKKSKSSIGSQTTKIAITFVCLTSVFALLLTYIFPDIIAMATQNTLFVEDLYYKGDEQAEINAKLDRDFIMYNLLNGNLNDYSSEYGDYSYATLSKYKKDEERGVNVYVNKDIQTYYNVYMNNYTLSTLKSEVIDVMEQTNPRKYELYQFIYSSYVLNDFTYAMVNTIERKALTLAILDYEYAHAGYERLLKEGFNNKKIKQLFDTNYDNFNQDGYQTFDDPLLLYAQLDSRMTVPVVLRLILNKSWMYSQPVYDENGNCYFTEDGNFLYEMYDPATKEQFDKDGGKYTETGKLMNGDGKEIDVKYGYNEDGWMVYENGVVKRPIGWLVLDMLGDKMDLATVDIMGALNDLLMGLTQGLPIQGIINNVLQLILKTENFTGSIGNLLQDDLQDVIEYAANGANLNIGLYVNDDGLFEINIYPMNARYGMLGYMQATWVQSNNLLMAVINLMGLRNWLCIFGAVGVVLVIAAGVLRECGRNTRLRTAVSRDRIIRSKTTEKINSSDTFKTDNNYESPYEPSNVIISDVKPTDAEVKAQEPIFAEQQPNQPLVAEEVDRKKKKKKKVEEATLAEPVAEQAAEPQAVEQPATVAEEPTPAVAEPIAEPETYIAEALPVGEKKRKKKHSAPVEIATLEQPAAQEATPIDANNNQPGDAIATPNETLNAAQPTPIADEQPAPISDEPLIAEAIPVDPMRKKKKKRPAPEVAVAVMEGEPPIDAAPAGAPAAEVAPAAEIPMADTAPIADATPASDEPLIAEAIPVDPMRKKKKKRPAPEVAVAVLEGEPPMDATPVAEAPTGNADGDIAK